MQTVTLMIDARIELPTKYKRLLENENSEVIITKDLIYALKIIQEQEPDLIIISDSIDYNLAEYCKRIRALTFNMRPVIVALSKSSDFNDRISVLENGADDFISEPISSDEFKTRIKAHLRREYESNLDLLKMLPNFKYTDRALKRVISSGIKWACLYITIDNLESYQENYTKLASDKLIQTYTAIINSTLDDKDYLGSLRENEYIIITNPYKAEKIANFLIFALDMVIPKFYSPEDVKRGYMITQGDEIIGKRAEFVHTTIGVVANEYKDYSRVDEIYAALKEVHDKGKLPSQSNFLFDRAKLQGEEFDNSFNNKVAIIEPDEAMALLLMTTFKMQGYEPKIYEKIPDEISDDDMPAFILLDAGNDREFLGLEYCKRIKNDEKYRGVKVIVSTIYHQKEMILNSGADLYLPKPYEISTLIKWVETLQNSV